jgi:signal transduction histidine kinase
MHLSGFITENMESILVEWEAFARINVPDAADMSSLALRDHAREMLEDIALDIETRQTEEERQVKSRGQAPDRGAGTAAAIHGTMRHASNYSLLQLSAEFRALRATVLRMWQPQVGAMTEQVANEMVRFNEAVDQALAESIVTYSARASEARELFLAILGHDLRSPLATVSLAGRLLAQPELPPDQRPRLAGNVSRAARLMQAMVDDLLGYTRTQLGGGMPIARTECDLHRICEEAVADAGAIHPGTRFDLHASGRLDGRFDCVRLHQLIGNLLVNAAQHGAKERPVTVDVRGDGDGATVRITNFGNAISDAALQSIFRPLVQLAPKDESDTRPSTSLGLGLYIAREIAEGHGGTIDVTSSEAEGTTFTVRLPWMDESTGGQPR